MAPDEEESPVRWWEFRGRVDPMHREGLELFRRRLRSALRVGHGLSVRFVLRWEGGRGARVLVGARDRTTQRWVVDLLSTSFDSGPWPEVEVEVERAARDGVRFAVPSPGFSPGVPSDLDEPAWGDVAAAGLAHLPRGTSVEWEYRSAPRAARASSPTDLAAFERVPPGHRVRVPPAPERQVADERLRAGWDLAWAGRGTLRGPGASDRTGPLGTESRTLSAFAHHPGNAGVTFRRPWPILRSAPPWFILGESELVGAFPSPWARPARLLLNGPSAGAPIWVGPEGRPGSVALPTDPGNGRHLVVLGETGMGKSSLLVRLGIQASRRASVVLMDPVGDTGERFLDALPPSALTRTVWISPSRSVVGLNALAPPPSPRDPESERDRRVSDLVDALRRVRSHRYGDTPFWGPRIEESVTLALTAAAAYPHGTIETAQRLLERAGRSAGAVPEPARSPVAELKERIAQRPEEVDGARRLLGEITRSPVLRRLLCDPSPRWSMARALEPGWITVVTGDAAQVSEGNARYLLAVELALLWSAVVARPTPGKVFVLMDEAHWFAHESAAEMFRMGRRYNLHVVLATQALQSLPEGVREAALTNAADFVLFRGSPAEAREIARWVPAVSAERLLALPRGHAAVLIDKGRALEWALVPGLPLSGRSQERLSEVALRSTEAFGTPEGSGTEPAGPRAERSDGRSQPSITTGSDQREMRILLEAVVAQTEAEGVARVPLNFLRVAGRDPDGLTLRPIGRELKGSGDLLRTLREAEGSVWLVRSPLRLAAVSPPATAAERDRARSLWDRWSNDPPPPRLF